MIDWDKVKKEGWSVKDRRNARILSIDGGGIRGIFPAQFLARIEDQINCSIHEYFDLIVGTSTGGIIALGLTLGIPAKEIVDLYLNNAEKIFKPKQDFIPKQFPGWLCSKYDNSSLANILKDTFKENRLVDANTFLCIPSIEHHKAKPKVYKTPHNANLHIDEKELMWKVALATSAAPIYFPAFIDESSCKLDGGLWANNPTTIGIAEAVYNGFSLDQIKVLSIGTGKNIYAADNKIAANGGIINWKSNLVEVTMNSQSEGYHAISKYLIRDKLTRIDFISKKKLELDSIAPDEINILVQEANTAFEESFRNNECIENNFFTL